MIHLVPNGYVYYTEITTYLHCTISTKKQSCRELIGVSKLSTALEQDIVLTSI